MARIITSLPVKNNDGRPIAREIAHTLATLRFEGVRVVTRPGCYGLWYGDDGRLYAEETVWVVMQGLERTIRRALAHFGHETGQLAMLAVPVTTGNSHILATAVGREGAAVLAKEHGGSTLLPDGTAVSYAYTAIDAAEYDAILA